MNSSLPNNNHQFDIEPIWQAENQNQIFQLIMLAMSRPGLVKKLDNNFAESKFITAVLACLVDAQVTVCDVDELISPSDWSLLQSNQANQQNADYLVCDANLPCKINPKLGSLSCPDHSATIILRVKDFNQDSPNLEFRGPGVDGEIKVNCSGLDQSWIQSRQQWCDDFPLGVDLILVSHDSVMAIPRSTQIKEL